MNNRFIILIIALFIGTTTIYGQPAKPKKLDPQITQGAKNLNIVLKRMYTGASKKLKIKEPCDGAALNFVKKIPLKNLLPTNDELAKSLDKIVQSFVPEASYGYAVLSYDAMSKSNSFEDYMMKRYKAKPATYNPKDLKRIKKDYARMKKFFEEGGVIYDKNFKTAKCVYSVKTTLFPFKWTKGFRKDKNAMTVEWDIQTRITISCDCIKGIDKEFKKAVFVYTGRSIGAVRTEHRYLMEQKIRGFHGFNNFGKMTNAKLKKYEIICCTTNDVNPPKDGSYIEPEDENINNVGPVLDIGLGAKFEKDVETMTTATAGIMFNVAPEGNPFFVGGRLNVCTSALIGSDITETIIRVGPSAEYQVPIGNRGVDILGGVNAGFEFGDVDAFGFKQNISGFGGNLYTGVEVPVGNNLNVGAVVSLFDYSNLTFKPKGEEGIKTSSSNSIFVTDRPNISLRLRIDIEGKQ